MRTLTVVTVAALLAALPALAGETRLRHDNYLAFVGEQGEQVNLAVTSIARTIYHEDLSIAILDRQSRRVLEQVVPLGTGGTIPYTVETAGLHAVAVRSGQPLCTARLVNRPFALVAWEGAPLWICGACARQFFFVPQGCKRFDLFVTADVTGEGATLKVLSPDDAIAVDKTDDFDKLTRVEVAVPAGMDGRPWAFTLENPQQGKLVLDDVEIYLGKQLPPYLCEDPAWLALFTDRHPGAAEKISARVPLKGASLQGGKPVELRFSLASVPAARMAALRGTATDVDYPGEGTFTLNGKGPYCIPVTGDGATQGFTVTVKPGDLVAGENVIVFSHDNRQSSAMGLAELAVLIGDEIVVEEEW